MHRLACASLTRGSLRGDCQMVGGWGLIGLKQLLDLHRRELRVRRKRREPLRKSVAPPVVSWCHSLRGRWRAEPSRDFRPRRLRIGAARVGVQERAPPCERCELLGDRIVQLLVYGRWRGWRSGLDGDDLRVPVGRQGNEVLEAKRSEDDITPNPNR